MRVKNETEEADWCVRKDTQSVRPLKPVFSFFFFFNENGSWFLVRASSAAAAGYRKPTHVTQETMATTYPGIAYEQQQQRETAVSH